MVLGSGCGFNVDNFQLNPSVQDLVSMIVSVSRKVVTGFDQARKSTVTLLLANGTDCSGNIFAAGPGTIIPGGAIVLVFSDNSGPLIPFNFQSLCDTGMPIYVLNSNCNRF
jgi:hypothetical protein